MKISDVFEPIGNGGVRSKRQVTIGSPPGPSATLSPGQQMNALSSMAGVTGQWILDNLKKDDRPPANSQSSRPWSDKGPSVTLRGSCLRGLGRSVCAQAQSTVVFSCPFPISLSGPTNAPSYRRRFALTSQTHWLARRAEERRFIGQCAVLLALLMSSLPLSAWAQGAPDIVWMRGGHSGEVLSVATSPDGELLASGSRDRTIKLWQAADGALIRTVTPSSTR